MRQMKTRELKLEKSNVLTKLAIKYCQFGKIGNATGISCLEMCCTEASRCFLLTFLLKGSLTSTDLPEYSSTLYFKTGFNKTCI